MYVKLTHAQTQAVCSRVPPEIADIMREHRVKRGITMHDYLLPAIGWRRVLDIMLAKCLGPAGGKLKTKNRPSDSSYLAIARIAEGLKRIEGHPALRGAAAVGFLPDVVPVFRTSRTTLDLPELIRPYPGLGSFDLLVPHHEIVNRQKITTWRPATPTERELLEPQCLAYQHGFHLLLAG